MSTQATMLPDVDTALQTILQGIHKRAYLERLEELGHVPQTVKEAEILVQLGFDLAQAEANPVLNKAAQAAEQPGPYAFAKQALDRFLGKEASAPSPDGLEDYSIAAAMELARDPQIFGSALVVKAAQQAALAEQATQS